MFESIKNLLNSQDSTNIELGLMLAESNDLMLEFYKFYEGLYDTTLEDFLQTYDVKLKLPKHIEPIALPKNLTNANKDVYNITGYIVEQSDIDNLLNSCATCILFENCVFNFDKIENSEYLQRLDIKNCRCVYDLKINLQNLENVFICKTTKLENCKSVKFDIIAPNLETLSIHKQNLVKIPEFVYNFPKLEMLCLNNNKITEIDENIYKIQNLVYFVMDCENLKVVNIEAIKKLKKLEYFSVAFTPISENDLKNLKQVFPNLEIYYTIC
jgi:Leucine-rich repeat (LRR) protein